MGTAVEAASGKEPNILVNVVTRVGYVLTYLSPLAGRSTASSLQQIVQIKWQQGQLTLN